MRIYVVCVCVCVCKESACVKDVSDSRRSGRLSSEGATDMKVRVHMRMVMSC